MADKIDINSLQNEAEGLESALNSSINAYNTLLRKNADLADDLSKISKGSDIGLKLATQLKNLNEKDILDKTKIKKLESDSSKLINEIRRNRSEVNRLEKELSDPLTRNKRAISETLRVKQSIVESDERLLDILQNILGVSVSISKESKYFSQASEFLNRIPVVGPTLAKPFRDIATAMDKAALKGGDLTDQLTAGFKAATGSIAALSLGFFIQQAFKASSQVADLQKSLLLSKNEAYALRDGFIEVAAASGDAFITTDKLLASNAALSKQLGFSKRFSDDLNIGFTNLTKRIGLSEEAAGGLAKASIITGRSMKSITEDASGAVSAISSQYGIQLNVQDVLERAGKSSSLLLANFKGNPIELAKAVAEMDALGTSLETTQKQANALLDFQSSIQNQLEASLITGRNINLNKARELALNNDLVGVAEELKNQQMDYNEFSQMNAIQRTSFAKSLGLESQELSDQLLKLEIIGKSRTEIAALYGKEAADRAMALSAQDKFNAAIEKLSGILANVMDGPLGKMVDLMAKIASSSATIYTFFGSLAAIQLGSAVLQIMRVVKAMRAMAIGGAIAKAIADPVGLAIGLAAAVGTGALISSMFDSNTEDDLMSGYGDRTLLTPNGAYALNNNDTVIAGTNLFRGNDVYSGPQGAINMTPPEFDYGKLAQAMSNVRLVSVSKPSEFAPFISLEQNKAIGVKA